MKVLAIFVITAVALATARPNWKQQQTSPFGIEPNTNGHVQTGAFLFNSQDYDENQKQTQQQRQQHGWKAAQGNQDYDENQQQTQPRQQYWWKGTQGTVSNDYNDSNNQQQGQNQQRQQHGWKATQGTVSNNDNDYNDSNNQQHGHQQQHNQQQQQWNQWNNNNNNDENIFTDNLTDVQPFHTKILHRIEESEQLTNQPEIKRKILKLVEDKFNVCKFNGAENKGKVDRHCVGRATGQIMQLIAAFENGSRNLPESYNF